MAIKKGDKVKVNYEGRFDDKDGEIFDSSYHGNHTHPIEFEVGSGQVILGFDLAVKGKEKGDDIEITIKPEDGYGSIDPNLKREIPRKALPKDQEPKVGMTLVMKSDDGHQFPVKIIGVNKDKITVDLNHPLAGKTLYFKMNIVDVS